MDEMRVIVLGIGVVVIALIYLWGMRNRIKAKLQERRRRAAARLPENEPVIDGKSALSVAAPSDAEEQQSKPAARDPFAHQRLVDVEIGPVKRVSPNRAAAGAHVETKVFGVPKTQSERTTSVRDKRYIDDIPEAKRGPVPVANSPGDISPEAPSEPGPMFDQMKEPELTVVITVLARSGKPFSGLRIKSVTSELELTLGDEGVFERYLDPHTRDKPVFGIAHLREPGTFSMETIETIETPGLLMFMRLPGIMDGVSALKRMVECAGELAHRLGGTLCDERRNKMTNQALIHLRTEVVELERRRRIWAQARRG